MGVIGFDFFTIGVNGIVVRGIKIEGDRKEIDLVKFERKMGWGIIIIPNISDIRIMIKDSKTRKRRERGGSMGRKRREMSNKGFKKGFDTVCLR
jgi:hypothetical protein